jgi:two-component system, chemotaxis family, CheB/CheR fusion protein
MSEQAFEHLLDHLCRTRGFDFAAYKRSSLKRRIDKRMEAIGVTSYEAYLDHLEVYQDEFSSLFNTILINVTSFFRDEQVWSYVASDVVPALIAAKAPHDPIRVWSAACASGEEAYTLAIILADALGEDAFRDRVKIYATDVDEQALGEARQATYTARQVAGIPPAHLEKYFDRVNSNFVFNKELRRSVIFGRHDLIQDAPISRVDLIACRNTLMYFNAEAQARIVARLYFALNDTGVLLLGKAEILFNDATMFQPLNLKRRIFRAMPKMNQRERLLIAAQTGRDDANAPILAHVRIREAAFDVDATPQIVVDAAGTLVLANDQARQQFGLSSRDLGRPLQDLELSYRPTELRAGIEQATVDRRAVTLKDIDWRGGLGDSRVMDILITPLIDPAGALLGQKISFSDVTGVRRLQEELAHSRQELETAMEELQSTNEELETTNEELQSTVEELETTNEELQSTNEELETMNEELQSTNEELQTMNEELRTRSGELNEVNAFLGSILTSFRAGVAVIDRNFAIQIWNGRAEDLWGVRADEVTGTHLLSLDIGLPVADLKPAIREVLSGADGNTVTVLDATNRRGRRFPCRVTCSPLFGGDHKVTGAILIMEDQRDLDDASSASPASSASSGEPSGSP